MNEKREDSLIEKQDNFFKERITDFSGIELLGVESEEKKQEMISEIQKKRNLIYNQLMNGVSISESTQNSGNQK